VATSDRHGECDCTSKFGEPGFIRTLSENILLTPNTAATAFSPISGTSRRTLISPCSFSIFFRIPSGCTSTARRGSSKTRNCPLWGQDTARHLRRVVKRREKTTGALGHGGGGGIQCSKHVPLLQKLDRKIDWGTNSVAAKKGDYFQLQDIPLYDRVCGDKAMEVAVDVFYRKVLEDDLVSRFFEGVDMEELRLRQRHDLWRPVPVYEPRSAQVQDMGLTAFRPGRRHPQGNLGGRHRLGNGCAKAAVQVADINRLKGCPALRAASALSRRSVHDAVPRQEHGEAVSDLVGHERKAGRKGRHSVQRIPGGVFSEWATPASARRRSLLLRRNGRAVL